MEKTLQSELIYGGRRLKLYRDEVELPSGKKTYREVVSHPGSVAVVPIVKEGEVLLIKQYRYAIKGLIYEIPAGTLEKGETVVVVEDVITTGGSTREVIQVVREWGGRVLAVGSLVDRSAGRVGLGVPQASLLRLVFPTYAAFDCPLCAGGGTPEKPGSRL